MKVYEAFCFNLLIDKSNLEYLQYQLHHQEPHYNTIPENHKYIFGRLYTHPYFYF
jgi:hypothetical protein